VVLISYSWFFHSIQIVAQLTCTDIFPYWNLCNRKYNS
jgi:hypothetical protein